MTKPINEPTPALEAANYGWRIRQLERRPDLRGDRLPWAFMEWDPAQVADPPFTATSGVQYPFSTLASATPWTYSTVGAAGVDVFFPDPDVGVIYWGGSDAAFIVAQTIAWWAPTFSGRVVTWTFLGQPVSFSGNTSFLPNISDGDLEGPRDSMLQMVVGPESTYATGAFRQDSGSDQDIAYASISVFRVDNADDRS